MIRRTRRQTNFTILSNTGLNDERLSLKAKGLLAYLLSKPDDWVVREVALAKIGPDGRDAVSSGLDELEKCGYLVRVQHHDEQGRFAWESVICDEPSCVENADKPEAGFPSMVNPAVDNPSLLSTDRTSTDLTSTDLEAAPASQLPFLDSLEKSTATRGDGQAKTAKVEKTERPPAVDVWRDVMHMYPHKAVWPLMADVTDLPRWREVLVRWLAVGGSPRNVEKPLQYYRDGWDDFKKGNNYDRRGTQGNSGRVGKGPNDADAKYYPPGTLVEERRLHDRLNAKYPESAFPGWVAPEKRGRTSSPANT